MPPSWPGNRRRCRTPAIQYSDFAVWQRQLLEGELGSRQREYWTRQLEGSPPLLGLPIDHPRPTMQTFAGALHVSTVDAAVAGAMRGLCRQYGATLFMTLLAAFKVLLHRYTGQTDILVGTPVANRSRVETEGLIGLLRQHARPENGPVGRADLPRR